MRPSEIVLVLIVLVFLIAQSVRGVERRYLFALAGAGLFNVVLSGFLGQARWQLAPAYLLLIVLSLLLLRRAFSHVAVRSLGVAFGFLLLAVSATASLGMPVLTLPAPDGPNVVGSTSLSLIDKTRNNSFFGAPGEPRELYLQIWYPGAFDTHQPAPRVRTLWEELYRGDRDLFTLFSSYLRGVRTHSYADIPLSPAQASYPVIFFSHAIVSFAEQNTLLMEHLASHGYVVVALSHPYASMRVVSSEGKAIYPNLAKINEASAEARAVDAEIVPRIEHAANAEQGAALQTERYERAIGLGALTEIWVDDLRFALDAVPRQPQFANRLDADRVGVLGMSFGGGAVTEFCKADARCRAVLSIDGPAFGHRQREPLRAPYLALIREGRRRSLDYLPPLARNDRYEIEVAGTMHLDFTDDTVVLPILKWFGMTGPIAGWRIIEITNELSLRFFDAYLRDAPKPRFGDEFPELTVETSENAGP